MWASILMKPREGTMGDAGIAPTTHEFTWSPDETVGSSVYLVWARVGDESITKRVVYLK